MIQFLPQALAVLGGIQGYRSAKQSGASGIGRLLGAGTGAFSGYQLGSMVPGAVPTATGTIAANSPFAKPGDSSISSILKPKQGSSLIDILTKKKELINTIQLNLQVY